MPTVQKLAVGIPGELVRPADWLNVCAKMINTAVVLLMDKVSKHGL